MYVCEDGKILERGGGGFNSENAAENLEGKFHN
jgi:hypothetical protein